MNVWRKSNGLDSKYVDKKLIQDGVKLKIIAGYIRQNY